MRKFFKNSVFTKKFLLEHKVKIGIGFVIILAILIMVISKKDDKPKPNPKPKPRSEPEPEPEPEIEEDDEFISEEDTFVEDDFSGDVGIITGEIPSYESGSGGGDGSSASRGGVGGCEPNCARGSSSGTSNSSTPTIDRINTDESVNVVLNQGQIFWSPNVINDNDTSKFNRNNLRYIGVEDRKLFDRRNPDNEDMTDTHVFSLNMNNKNIEVQVNANDFNEEDAEKEAEKYLVYIGKLPDLFLDQVRTVTIHKGDLQHLWGGGNNGLLIHTGIGEDYIDKGIVEEVLLHESTHTSLDEVFNPNTPIKSNEWLETVNKDDLFISRYAKENARREDLAETLPIYYAIRRKRDNLTEIDDEELELIEDALQNRFEFLDEKLKDKL